MCPCFFPFILFACFSPTFANNMKNSLTLWCLYLQTSLLVWSFYGDVQWHLSSKRGVYNIQRVQSSAQTIFSQYSTGLSKCCAANFKQASTCFPFNNGVLCGECAYRTWWLSALPVVFFEAIVPGNSRSFWGSPQVVFSSWTTLPIIHCQKSCGEPLYMADLCWNYVIFTSGSNSAQWNIQKFGNSYVTNTISKFYNNRVVKVLRPLHWQGTGLFFNYWLISTGVLAFRVFLHFPFFVFNTFSLCHFTLLHIA